MSHRPRNSLTSPNKWDRTEQTNADEGALRTARPRVTVWIDELRHAGHVVFVPKAEIAAGPMMSRSAQMALGSLQFPLPSPQTLRDFYDIIVGRVYRVWGRHCLQSPLLPDARSRSACSRGYVSSDMIDGHVEREFQ